MRSLSAADLVRVWELGQNRPNWQRALLLLAPCFPQHKPSQLSRATVGQRNAWLLAIQRHIGGRNLNGFVRCPICREALEFSETVAGFLKGYQPPASREGTVQAGSIQIRFRLMDSRDLAAVVDYPELEGARQDLIARSVIEARDGAGLVPASRLPADAVAILAREIAKCDPLCDTRIPLACVNCNHVWSAGLDVVSFLWTEVERKAKRFLDDVHALAKAYAWREEDILAMSAARRQYYIGAIE